MPLLGFISLRKFCLMKKILLLISVLLTQYLSAQDMLGVANSNFAGSTGMQLNPASMMLTPYCWEVTLVTFDLSVENNYMGIIKNKKSMLMSDASPDIVEDRIVNDYYTNTNKNANVHFILQLPSFIYKTDEWAFGFRPLLRNDLDVRNIPASIARLSYLGLKRANLEGTNVKLDDLTVGGLAWMQYSFSAGHQLQRNDERVVLAAASLNFLNALEGAYVKLNSGTMSIPDDSTLSLNNLEGTAAQAINTNLSLLRCNGISTDVGVEYIFNPGRVKYKDGKEKMGKKYNYRLGISIIDLGFVKFNEASNFNFTDASVTYMNPTSLKANGIEGVDSLIGASVQTNPTSSFRMALPTSLNVQYDKALSSRVYFNVSAVQRISMPMPQVRRPNSVSMSLRYETPFFEIGLPYSCYDYYRHRVGFAMRYRFFFAGTDKLGTFVGSRDITGLDVYFGIKLTNFDFKKKNRALCCKTFY
jgi:hypothetical protein